MFDFIQDSFAIDVIGADLVQGLHLIEDSIVFGVEFQE